MSANATRSNTAVEAPDTNTGRIDHIHISHGGEQAPATSAAVVGASPNVGKGQEPQETPQRAPQAKWLEGLVRSIQGLGAGNKDKVVGPQGSRRRRRIRRRTKKEKKIPRWPRLTQPRRVSLKDLARRRSLKLSTPPRSRGAHTQGECIGMDARKHRPPSSGTDQSALRPFGWRLARPATLPSLAVGSPRAAVYRADYFHWCAGVLSRRERFYSFTYAMTVS
ncbi:hypothetical protein AB1Y20_015329 [Prymnesium parvum]|uniref:Uncharacterized protein n=1 Tax=Prymnesium parvum TaxID=97485 RepID=A0AB34JY65_PRYPA